MNPIRKIVIVGGGSSGWLTAAMLSHHLSREMCQIELVESAELGTIGIGESTVPPFVGLLRRLGIDEDDFIAETQATYKLGIKFEDWHTRRSNYFHPFGYLGKPIEGHDFYQCWLKARSMGEAFPLQDFSPCNVMAEGERFFRPDKARHTPIGGANYALHLDASAMARYLQRYAEARGVVQKKGLVQQVQESDTGHIEKLRLETGEVIQGDFFVDCSGFRAVLIGQQLQVGYQDWSDYLPCDRAIAVKTQSDTSIPPYTLASAQKSGWTWRIPLQHRTGRGYVYASRFCSDAQAKSTLMRTLEQPLVDEPRLIPFKTGHRKKPWKRNCLSVGLAAGFVEPLESTSLHLIARSVDFFLRYFPDKDCDPALVREYNRRILGDYEEVRDFILLHYAASARDDSDFWRWCQSLPLPDSLRERIELFQGHGALRQGVDELFKSTSWQSVFEGMGITPGKHCPRVENLPLDTIHRELRSARQAIRGMVRTLPSHNDFLASEK